MIIKLFGLFLIVLLIIIVIGMTILGSIFRFLLGNRKKRQTAYGHTPGSQPMYEETSEREQKASPSDYPKSSRKVFDKDDGEYVDFEEIK